MYNGDGDGETEMKTANNPTEAIELIKHYEEIIRIQHKRVIQYIHNIYNIQYTIYKQGEILKMFKETENFIDNVG